MTMTVPNYIDETNTFAPEREQLLWEIPKEDGSEWLLVDLNNLEDIAGQGWEVFRVWRRDGEAVAVVRRLARGGDNYQPKSAGGDA